MPDEALKLIVENVAKYVQLFHSSSACWVADLWGTGTSVSPDVLLAL